MASWHILIFIRKHFALAFILTLTLVVLVIIVSFCWFLFLITCHYSLLLLSSIPLLFLFVVAFLFEKSVVTIESSSILFYLFRSWSKKSSLTHHALVAWNSNFYLINIGWCFIFCTHHTFLSCRLSQSFTYALPWNN